MSRKVQEMRVIQCGEHKGNMVSDDAREEDMVQSRSFGNLLSEFAHYSKSNGKVLKSFRKEDNIIFVF